MIPGLTPSVAAAFDPYLLAMIQKVSPASIVIWLVLAAIELPGMTAAIKS